MVVEIGSARETEIETLHVVMAEIEKLAAIHMMLGGQAAMSEEVIEEVIEVVVEEEVTV